MRVFIVIVLCLAGVSLVSCTHTSPPIASAPPAYGMPGAGKIQVLIVGDVKNPGKYWIPESSNLVFLESVFGGWGGHGDFGGTPPVRVNLIRKVDGREVRTTYSLRAPPEQKATVTLEDGDIVEYPAVIF